MERELSTEEFIAMLEDVAMLKPKRVIFTGMGLSSSIFHP
jgi:hypothetical protein